MMAAATTDATTDPTTTPATTTADGPIVLRLEIGWAFDSYGIVELHASGEVTYAPSGPEYEQKLRNVMLNMRRRPDQPVEEEMREMPGRLRTYLWARLVDETGAEIVPEGHWTSDA